MSIGMKTIEYTGVQSPWYDTLGGSGLTWTTGMQAELENDVADELLGYVTIFKFISESGSAVTLPNIQAAYDSGSAEEKAAFQSSVSGAGSVTIDATRVDTTLSAAEQQAQQLVFAGALAADVTFDIGALRRRRAVDAQTTGVGRLLLKFGAAGSAFAVPKNEMVEVQ